MVPATVCVCLFVPVCACLCLLSVSVCGGGVATAVRMTRYVAIVSAVIMNILGMECVTVTSAIFTIIVMSPFVGEFFAVGVVRAAAADTTIPMPHAVIALETACTHTTQRKAQSRRPSAHI